MGLHDDDPGPEEPPKLPMMLQDIFIQKLPGITGHPCMKLHSYQRN